MISGSLFRNRPLLALALILSHLFVLNAAAFVSAADRSKKTTAIKSPEYQRFFVPADAPESWPLGAERYLPISNEKFLQLVKSKTEQAVPDQRLQAYLKSATYRAELQEDDVLVGDVEFEVELPASRPKLLSLSPLNLVIDSAYWQKEPEKSASLGLWGTEYNSLELGVWARESDTLQLKWQLAPHQSTTSRVEYQLDKPIVVPQIFEIILPKDRFAELANAELLKTQPEVFGKTRWVYQLAPKLSHQLSITRSKAKRDSRDLPFVSRDTSYRLSSAGLDMTTRLRIDARESDADELRAALDSQMRVVEVRMDQQTIEWRTEESDETGAILRVPLPNTREPLSVEIDSLLKPHADISWTLPSLKFDQVFWTEGTISLLVSPDLELRSVTPQKASLQHIVGIQDSMRRGEVYRFQEWSDDARVELEIGRPVPRSKVRSSTVMELDRAEARASIMADLQSMTSPSYQVQAEIAAGWSIDSVKTSPKQALNEWHISSEGSSRTLFLQLNRPITEEESLRIDIEARQTSGQPILPCAARKLRVLRFLHSEIQTELLQLQLENVERIILPTKIEQALFTETKTDVQQPAFLPNPVVEGSASIVLNLSQLNDFDIVELLQQPANYQARLDIQCDVKQDSFQQRYLIEGDVLNGAISELLLESRLPLPAKMQWKLAGNPILISMQPVSETDKRSQAGPFRYKLPLTAPQTGAFQLEATYARPAQRIEQCNLIQLPRAQHWQGQIVLSGSLQESRVLDQGWTPTVSANETTTAEQPQVLGTYRWNRAEFRRAKSNIGLQIERQAQQDSAANLFAWLSEYETSQAADGTAIHTANYSLENLGAGEARFALPTSAELLEVWLNRQSVEVQQDAQDANGFFISLDRRQRWLQLALKYSTRGEPLAGSTAIKPVVPESSFQVNRSLWTLWAPAQFEFDAGHQADTASESHWWNRIFGPLARSREEVIFRPHRSASWSALWSSPLAEKQSRRLASALAEQLKDQLASNSEQPLGNLLDNIADQAQANQSVLVDYSALNAKGIQAMSTANEFVTANASRVLLSGSAQPLSNWGLAIVVSSQSQVLTTTDRIAHWRDQLQPTMTAGVYLVDSQDLANRLEADRSAGWTEFIRVAQWLDYPVVSQTSWSQPTEMRSVNFGHHARTVEFVGQPSALIVRRAYSPQSLCYAIFLLTFVVGVWQLAHYPNIIISAGVLSTVGCLLAPPQWLAVLQALFLGLVAAAVIRFALKILQYKNLHFSRKYGVASSALFCFVLCVSLPVQIAFGQQSTKPGPAKDQSSIPRVLLPINSAGQRQGNDLYVSEKFLKFLERPLRPKLKGGAEFVILSANYRVSFVPESNNKTDLTQAIDAPTLWTMRWKIETFQSNCQFQLPLIRSEAEWNELANLDGLPITPHWQAEGRGCLVVIPEVGVHWLELAGRPQVINEGHLSKLRLHVPPIPGAKLELEHISSVDDLRVLGAGKIRQNDTFDRSGCLLAGNETIELQWLAKQDGDSPARWDKLRTLAWLKVASAAAQLDMQLSFTGYRGSTDLLELEISPQLKLRSPGQDSPVLEVLESSSNQPARVQLKLRRDLPNDFILPLKFDLQRGSSLGQYYFPRVRVVGGSPEQNFFAVSVDPDLSYVQQATSSLNSIETAEFSTLWSGPTLEPQIAYVLSKNLPAWSLRVEPAPQSFSSQQTLQMHCLQNRVEVDFEANVNSLTGSLLSHRVQIPAALKIESVVVKGAEEPNLVPVRWSRPQAEALNLFFGQPMENTHLVVIKGYLDTAPNEELMLPQIHLLGGQTGDIHLDLYRTEDMRADWVTAERIPQRADANRFANNDEEIHVGHYFWRPAQLQQLSSLKLQRNDKRFQATTLTTIEPKLNGWMASLQSNIAVQRGTITRLTLEVPSSFQPPYKLQPKTVGVVDAVEETENGKRMRVLLAKPAAEDDEIEIRVDGTLGLPADRRLVMPSLRWSDAVKQTRYLLLPTMMNQRPIDWQKNGLRRKKLPGRLQVAVSAKYSALPYLIVQDEFQATERKFRGKIRNALVRHARISGILDDHGAFAATAEFLLQPGRANSCRLQLPPHSLVTQLVVGDTAARREMGEDGSWTLPLGPPFMPQRILVTYVSAGNLDTGSLQLSPPKILLGDQALPNTNVWWSIRTNARVQLGEPEIGQPADRVQFAKSSYQQTFEVLRDALSQALELPAEEREAWARVWRSLTDRAKSDWQVSGERPDDDDQLANIEQTAEEFFSSFSMMEVAPRPRYPVSLAANPLALPAQSEHFFCGGSEGQLVVSFSVGQRSSLGRWFTALALICGTGATILRLRHRPDWHYELCRWPHSLALVGGFTWWLLLKPSVLGMLAIWLVLASLCLKKWRSHQNQKESQISTQLATPTS